MLHVLSFLVLVNIVYTLFIPEEQFYNKYDNEC